VTTQLFPASENMLILPSRCASEYFEVSER
jgi:hypothetical protein